MATGKSLSFHIGYVAFLLLSLLSFKDLKVKAQASREPESVGYLEKVRIRVYGKEGVEWLVKGERLYSAGVEVVLDKVHLSSQEYEIKAMRGNINRINGKGLLLGGVEVRGSGLFIKTSSANIDLKTKKIWGSGDIEVWRYGNYISGSGYEIYLSPLKVIIEKVKTRHDA